MYLARPEVEEKDCVEMLKWFHKTYKGGVTSDQFRCFFPAINTGQHLSDMVFRYIEGLNFKSNLIVIIPLKIDI